MASLGEFITIPEFIDFPLPLVRWVALPLTDSPPTTPIPQGRSAIQVELDRSFHKNPSLMGDYPFPPKMLRAYLFIFERDHAKETDLKEREETPSVSSLQATPTHRHTLDQESQNIYTLTFRFLAYWRGCWLADEALEEPFFIQQILTPARPFVNNAPHHHTLRSQASFFVYSHNPRAAPCGVCALTW